MEFTCSVCAKTFSRSRSQVRNATTVCCSKNCTGIRLAQTLVGKNNPNFRHGNAGVDPPDCACGNRKDYRAKRCASCTGKSYGKGTKGTTFTPESLTELVRDCSSYLEAQQKSGIGRATIRKYCERFGIDLSHFRPGRGRFAPVDTVLCKDSKYDRATAKQALLRLELVEESCKRCGAKEWLGEKLTLEMNHIDGDRWNHSVENLELLCPNCHSLTPTHRGKNVKYRGPPKPE
jgi:hypothetical protein